ncbi:MAG: class I SAM-dependent methyltransferase [Anaerolineae bacterium]|jgi:ubiquinone/menaquinone biosynthesis C-methylase UbiE
MSEFATKRAQEFYARTSDTVVPDWPGEIDFYRELAAKVFADNQAVLEVACGTGRVAIRLAQQGGDVAGLDLSPAMLDVAREKSAGMRNVRWVHGDMRSFDLGEAFGLAIIPGHSFQNILTPVDQLLCLTSIRRHLVPGGLLVVHLDQPEVDWLGDLTGDQAGVFEATDQFVYPKTGRTIRTLQAWSYQPATQTAISHKVWEELGPDGQVVDRLDRGPIRLHVVFRFEMEHLLVRAGFAVEAVYGDFYRQELRDGSSDMIWLAVKE